MAHSISSTRALQAVWGQRGDAHQVCLCANQRAKRTHAHTYRHISCPVLVWPPGRSSGGETEPQTPWTAEHLPSSCAWGLTAQVFDHITGSHIKRSCSNLISSSSCVSKTMFRHKTLSLLTFHSTYALLAEILEATFHAVPSHSVKCGDVAAALADRMAWRPEKRPLWPGGVFAGDHSATTPSSRHQRALFLKM